MTRAETIDLQDAFNHFADGGELWFYASKEWKIQKEFFHNNFSKHNIIEDKHFEARKAHALGQPIELSYNGIWITLEDMSFPPRWDPEWDYRPKQPEPEYEWYYLIVTADSNYNGIGYFTEDEISERSTFSEILKVEESKRIRK